MLSHFSATRSFALRARALSSSSAEPETMGFRVSTLIFGFFPHTQTGKLDGQVQPLIFDAATAFPFRMNLVPFVHLGDYEIKSEMWLNLIGNCAMFIPTGIIVPILYPNCKSFKKTALTGFLISLTIEIIQLPFAVRCSDVDDLILNTAGCIIGYGIYALVKRRKHVSV